MNAITVEGVTFLSVAWLYWAERIVEPLSLDGAPILGDIALPFLIPTTELKGVAV